MPIQLNIFSSSKNLFSSSINNPEFSDVRIICKDGEEVVAASFVLRYRCEYFKTCLSETWTNMGTTAATVLAESKTSSLVCNLPSISKPIFLFILEYLYTNTVTSIPPESILALALAANELLLPELVELAVNALFSNVPPSPEMAFECIFSACRPLFSSSESSVKLLEFAMDCLSINVALAIDSSQNWLARLDKIEIRQLLSIWTIPTERFQILIGWAKASLNISSEELEANDTSTIATSSVSSTNDNPNPHFSLSTNATPSFGTNSSSGIFTFSSSSCTPYTPAATLRELDNQKWLKDPVQVAQVRKLISPLFMLVEIFSWEQTQFILIAKQYIEAGIVDEATKECISAKFGQVVVGINNEIHNLKSLFYRIEVADQQIALPSCSIPVSNRLSKAISREFRYYSSGKKWVNRFSKSIGKIPNGTCPDDSMGHFVHVIHTGTFLGSVYAIARRSMEGSVDVVFHQSFNGEVHRHVMASRAGMGNDSKFPSSPLPPYINFDHSSGKFFLTLPAPMFAINYMEVSAIESFSLE